MEQTQDQLIEKKVEGTNTDDVSENRAYVYDPTKNLKYSREKGLKKPGRISFDVLRRASYSVHIARICINVLKEKVSKTPWVIKAIDPLKEVSEERQKELEEFFKHPNRNSETFRTLLDKMLEDLLSLDAVSLEKTRYPDGKLAELFHIDSATIRPVYDQFGRQDVEIPLNTKDEKDKMLPVSYLQVLNNSQYGGPESGDIVAAWPKKDFIYFCMHPQGAMEKFGYGMSPLESVLSVVSNLLNADNYNGTYFEEGSMPPVILQLLGNVNPRDLQGIREYLYSELQGSWHRPAIMAGREKIETINLKEFTNKDMEFMEYMKFMSRLLAAAYGLSGQDIGLTEEVGSKNVSETMKDLSEAKGYGSILHLLKEVFNQEVIWKDFGYQEFEFDWVAADTTDPKEAMSIYDQALKNGSMTLNEVREKLGETPFGDWADTPRVLTVSGYIPVLEVKDEEQHAEGDDKKEEEDVDEKKKEVKDEKKVGGEEPYDDQAESEMKKMIFTTDGYKTYLDDRGYSQPFICYHILTGRGYLIKPPVAVNLTSQDLEVELSRKLIKRNLNVPLVEKVPYVDILGKVLQSDQVRFEFDRYVKMLPEYDSEKWRAKFGGSRLFPYYLVEQFIPGRNLKDSMLLDDMKRDPDSYMKAIEDLAALWKAEKALVLGDRRGDQYIITNDKRAWGIDYQFAADLKRWEGTKDSIKTALNTIPELHDYFVSLTTEPTLKEKIKSWFVKTRTPNPDRIHVDDDTAMIPILFGELARDTKLRKQVEDLFNEQDKAKLLSNGFRERIYTYDWHTAMIDLRNFIEKNPKSYGGLLFEQGGGRVQYSVYTKFIR